MHIFLTGMVFSAKDAFDWGIVQILSDEKELVSKTKELALEIMGNGPIALSMTKKALKSASRSDLNSQLDLLSTFQGIAQRTEDHFEGLRALSEKERPNFKGR